MPYSLKALKTFEAAARLGSFKAAAEELLITPTAVSHQIRALEDTLGLKLFERLTRATNLTHSGEVLSSRIAPAFAAIETAMQDFLDSDRVLRATMTPAFAANWLAPRQTEFNRNFPDIRLSVETGHIPLDLARNKDIGIAIRYSAERPHPNASLLVRERFSVFGTAAYLSSLKGLGDAHFAVTDWQQPTGTAPDIADWLGAAAPGCDPVKLDISRFDQEHHAISLALSGQALVFCSDVLVSNLVGNGLLHAFDERSQIEGLAYWTILNPDTYQKRPAERFRAWVSSKIQAT